jgi:putative NADPH-quinone reductase
MLMVAAGHPAEYYNENGRHKATALQILHPINHGTLAFCGFDVHEPYIALNVMGLGTASRAKALTDLQFRLEHLSDSPQWLIKYS